MLLHLGLQRDLLDELPTLEGLVAGWGKPDMQGVNCKALEGKRTCARAGPTHEAILQSFSHSLPACATLPQELSSAQSESHSMQPIYGSPKQTMLSST